MKILIIYGTTEGQTRKTIILCSHPYELKRIPGPIADIATVKWRSRRSRSASNYFRASQSAYIC